MILQDKADEIINLQASLLFGVAREICNAQALKTGNNVGILNKKQCQEFIDHYRFVLGVELDVSEVMNEY